MANKKIWIIDDDKSIRWVIDKTLTQNGYDSLQFSNANDAINEFNRREPSLIISDISMPGESGLDLLQKVTKQFPHIPIIIMTAFADLQSTIDAYKFGAFEFLTKPFEIENLLDLVRKALKEKNLQKTQIEKQTGNTILLGNSESMHAVYRSIGKLSRSNASILITGESGTGKELVAKSIHMNSSRAENPFIVINAAAIPNDLLESELFGYEKGAFTGASSSKEGFFESAYGGTLFLDEIGDMPINLQAKILRVLNDGVFQKVGSNKDIRSNVRILAATHKDLDDMIKNNQFREDLYHRLNVINIHLPPLRDRPDDIPQLSEHFLRSSSVELGVSPKFLNPETLNYFKRLQWKGNVRQLRNICHWLTVMVTGNEIGVSDLPAELINENINRPASSDWLNILKINIQNDIQSGSKDLYNKYVELIENVLLETALAESNNKKIQAAKILGIGRNTFSRKFKL
jgi:two-component system nitrogen regulation response regulator GlnG